jgi:tetratricopeptide (TPR) repeat protein
MAERKIRIASNILLRIALTKIEMGQFAGALEDLKQMDSDNLMDIKYSNMGYCYFKLGLYEEAEREYKNAIYKNSKIAAAYYNLAALYAAEEKIDRAKTFLYACLKVDRNFMPARVALKHLQNVSDWYEWWFKTTSDRRALGIVVSITFFGIIWLYAHRAYQDADTDIGLAIPLGLLAALLMLPSIKKIKVGNVELEVMPVDSPTIQIEPIVIGTESQHIKAHIKFT